MLSLINDNDNELVIRPVVKQCSNLTEGSELVNINQAIANFATETGGCVQWITRTNQRDYVEFTSNDSGCYSYVGRIGGRQVSRL